MARKYPHDYLKETADEMAAVYRRGLARLEIKMGALMRELERVDMASYRAIGSTREYADALGALRDEVESLLAQRKNLIQNGVHRGYVQKYTDTLYAAERIVKARFPEWAREPSPEQVAAAFTRRSASMPSFSAMLDKGAATTRAKLVDGVGNLMTRPNITADEFIGGIRTAFKQDFGRTYRAVHSFGAKPINEAAVSVFKTTKDLFLDKARQLGAGVGAVLVWIHDDPTYPREYHATVLHGCLADADGYWHDADGDIARCPGGFGNDANNIGCRCTLDMMLYSEWLAEFGGREFPEWMYDPGRAA